MLSYFQVFISYLEEKQRKEHIKNSQAQLATKNSTNYQSYSHKKILSPKKAKK